MPGLYKTIMSIFPNEENNPGQAELYRAFSRGDIEQVLEVPRKEREQVFVTSLRTRFTNNIESTGFDELDYNMGGGGRSSNLVGTGAEVLVKMMQAQRVGEEFEKHTVRFGEGEGDAAQGGGANVGFVVSIAGYSPYKDMDKLLYPTGVGDNKDQWGVVTRLLNLAELGDANSAFELFRPEDVEHFDLKMGVVELDSEMPEGIGMLKKREDSEAASGGGASEEILVDPLTKEKIGKVAVLDENGKSRVDRNGKVVYETNDHWYTLEFKLRWKNPPEKLKESQQNPLATGF